MQSKQNPFKIGGWYNPLPEDQKSEEARIHWHPFPLKPLPIKEGAQSQGGQPEKLTDELLINQKLTCMGGIFFEQCFGAKEAEDQKAHTQRNLWQCKVCEECFVLCKECTKESERLREKMLEQSPEMLQAEELTLAYLDFFSQLRVEPPTTIPEYTWKNQFIDEIGDNRVERKYTRAAQKQPSASQPQAEDKKEQGPPEEILAQAKKNAFNYLMKNRASIVVIGNQNVGKSTFLNKLLNLELLNTSNNRETAALWKIVFKKSSSTQALPQLGGAGIAGDANHFYLRACLINKKLEKINQEKLFSNLEQLNAEVQTYSLTNQAERLQQGDLKKLEKVVVTLPQSQCVKGGLFDGIKADSLKVFDIPGVEDDEFADKINRLIKKKRSHLLPIFLINADAGTAKLTEFQKISEIYKDSKDDLQLPVVFTKLSFAMLNAKNNLQSDGLLEGKDAEQRRIMIIERTQQHILKLRDDIRETLPNTRFYLYDPTCNGRGANKKYWILRDSQDLTILEDRDRKNLNEEKQAKWYAINDPFTYIRGEMRVQFEGVMKQNQFRVKSANAFVACKMQQLQLRRVAMEQIQEGGKGNKQSEYLKERYAEIEEAGKQITGTLESLVKFLHDDMRIIIPEILEQANSDPLLESEHLTEQQKSEAFKKCCERFVNKKIAQFVKKGDFIVPKIFLGTDSLEFLKKDLPRKITNLYHIVIFFNKLRTGLEDGTLRVRIGNPSDDDDDKTRASTNESVKKEEESKANGVNGFLNALLIMQIMSDCRTAVLKKIDKLKATFQTMLHFDKSKFKRRLESTAQLSDENKANIDTYIEDVMGVKLKRINEILNFLKMQADPEEIRNRMPEEVEIGTDFKM